MLQISLDELEKGYRYDSLNGRYTCLICGRVFEKGEIFERDGKLFEASKAVGFHMADEHGGMLGVLLECDKKETGLTENQIKLLRLIAEGKSDTEIAGLMGSAPATVRRQRFTFREKARQAKLYLAVYEIAEKTAGEKKGKGAGGEAVRIHSGAKMVDDRYFVTESEEARILAAAFEPTAPLRLKSFSPKEKKKIVILRRIAAEFEKGRRYPEKEVNAILGAIYGDYATIRRYLIEYGFMQRTKDCGEYWINEGIKGIPG